MEEIDIIEQFLDDELNDLYEIYHTGYINKVVMAIKQVINRLEQLEKELEPIRKLGLSVETMVEEFLRLEDLEDDRDYLITRIKELEKENKELSEELNSVKEIYYTEKEYGQLKKENEELKETQKILQHNYTVAINEEQQNSIPKSVIREKIKELEEYEKLATEQIDNRIVIADSNSLNYGRAQAHSKDMQVLKELLGDEQ